VLPDIDLDHSTSRTARATWHVTNTRVASQVNVVRLEGYLGLTVHTLGRSIRSVTHANAPEFRGTHLPIVANRCAAGIRLAASKRLTVGPRDVEIERAPR
jgi:hypothetical protein